MQDYYGLEVQTRHLIRRRLAEAERERLAGLAARPRRALRADVADALRALAARLDGQPGPGRERRLVTAR
jgi:hypothetical protein